MYPLLFFTIHATPQTLSCHIRVCVTTKLPRGVQLRLELLVSLKGAESVSHMHVQSLSHWAPPNIGPYSQAYTVRMGGAWRN